MAAPFLLDNPAVTSLYPKVGRGAELALASTLSWMACTDSLRSGWTCQNGMFMAPFLAGSSPATQPSFTHMPSLSSGRD